MSTRATARAVAVLALIGVIGVMAASTAQAETRPGFYAGIGGGNSHLQLGNDDRSMASSRPPSLACR
jgi:hypothetical protein